MRGVASDPNLQPRGDELLTTGEAAKILNCTRQHVVDLCDRGDLPYTTVGTHRRISRRNVEALKTRTDRLSRDERRSLWLAYVVAGRIATEPERMIGDALRRLDKMRPNARGQAKKWLEDVYKRQIFTTAVFTPTMQGQPATAGINRFSAGLVLALPRLQVQFWIVVRFPSQLKTQWPGGQVAWLTRNTTYGQLPLGSTRPNIDLVTLASPG